MYKCKDWERIKEAKIQLPLKRLSDSSGFLIIRSCMVGVSIRASGLQKLAPIIPEDGLWTTAWQLIAPPYRYSI